MSIREFEDREPCASGNATLPYTTYGATTNKEFAAATPSDANISGHDLISGQSLTSPLAEVLENRATEHGPANTSGIPTLPHSPPSVPRAVALPSTPSLHRHSTSQVDSSHSLQKDLPSSPGEHASTTSNISQGWEIVLTALRRMAKLRMISLETKSAASEKSMRMRIRQREAMTKIHTLLEDMKQRSAIWALEEPVPGQSEPLTEWELCFAEIDRLIKSGELAAVAFDEDQNLVREADWILCEMEQGLEQKVYEHESKLVNFSLLWDRAKATFSNKFLDKSINDKRRLPDLERQSASQEADPAEEIEREPDDRVPIPGHARFYSDASSDVVSMFSLEVPVHDPTTLSSHHVESASSPGSRKDNDSDNIGRDDHFDGRLGGSQFGYEFLDISQSIIVQGPRRRDPLDTVKKTGGFARDELDDFVRWLLLDSPQTYHLSPHREVLMRAISNPRFLSALIWHTLGDLCLAQSRSSAGSDSSEGLTSTLVSFLTRYTRQLGFDRETTIAYDVGSLYQENAEDETLVEARDAEIHFAPPTPKHNPNVPHVSSDILSVPSTAIDPSTITSPTGRRRSSTTDVDVQAACS